MVSFKDKVQKFGKFLSGMVMPNIGAFIAWGLITALFIPSGWIPIESFATLVDPMLKYLLPILIGFTGGKMVGGVRGGVIGAVATTGVIVGSEIPMFIGAMVVGPISGYVIKKFDDYVEGKIASGFEMLINNFSIGILGLILAIISLLAIGPVISAITGFLSIRVSIIIRIGLLPLVSIFVEPAKVLFLNNAINHGIFGPIGIEQVQQLGKSVLFLLESNPGPGLGVILAYFFFSKGAVKQSSVSAGIIHFFGGIHEIYFPYILMNPILILSVILGSAVGIFIFSIFSVGLVATPSPGSIISIMALAAKGDLLKILIGVIASTVVSFFVASIFIKRSSGDYSLDSLDKAKNTVGNLKNSNTKEVDMSKITKIVFSCDAGMGSSAMGASKFKNRLKKQGVGGIDVSYSSVDNIPSDAQVVVTHENLESRVASDNVLKVVAIKNFLSDPNIEFLFSEIVEANKSFNQNEETINDKTNDSFNHSDIFTEENIILDVKVSSKEDAIKMAGELLVKRGYVEDRYVSGMLEREKLISTYIGMGVAIPHGEGSFKDSVKKSGIVLLQVKDGVDFGDEKAYLVFGIAGVGNEHIKILSSIATTIEDKTMVEKLISTNSKKEVIDIISKDM